MHRRRADHRSPFPSRRVTFNARPNCCSVFSSRSTAIDHLVRPFAGNCCPRSRSIHTRTDHITGKGQELQCRMSQVVHTSHTTPPAHPHAPPPDATSYHQALSMHQMHHDFHLTRTRKKSVTQTRAQMEHQTPCHQQLLQCRDRARRGERAQRQRRQPHSTTVSSRQSFGWLSSQRTTRSVGGQPCGNVSGLHRLTGLHSHARRGPTVPSGGTNI